MPLYRKETACQTAAVGWALGLVRLAPGFRACVRRGLDHGAPGVDAAERRAMCHPREGMSMVKCGATPSRKATTLCSTQSARASTSPGKWQDVYPLPTSLPATWNTPCNTLPLNGCDSKPSNTNVPVGLRGPTRQSKRPPLTLLPPKAKNQGPKAATSLHPARRALYGRRSKHLSSSDVVRPVLEKPRKRESAFLVGRGTLRSGAPAQRALRCCCRGTPRVATSTGRRPWWLPLRRS